jgi:hypothetical protein
MFQGNCDGLRGFSDQRRRRAASSIGRTRVCGNMRGPAPPRQADLLSRSDEAPVKTISRASGMPQLVVGRLVHPAQGLTPSPPGTARAAYPDSGARRRNTYAASSMAKIAVSG